MPTAEGNSCQMRLSWPGVDGFLYGVAYSVSLMISIAIASQEEEARKEKGKDRRRDGGSKGCHTLTAAALREKRGEHAEPKGPSILWSCRD